MNVTDDQKKYNVVFVCGLTVSLYKLTNNERYPNIVEDERASLGKLANMHADVMLAPHGFYFDLAGKVARQKPRSQNPFVDPTELSRHVKEMKEDLEEALRSQEKQRFPKVANGE